MHATKNILNISRRREIEKKNGIYLIFPQNLFTAMRYSRRFCPARFLFLDLLFIYFGRVCNFFFFVHLSPLFTCSKQPKSTFLRDPPRHKRPSVVDRHKWHRLSTENVAVARFAQNVYGHTGFFNQILLTSAVQQLEITINYEMTAKEYQFYSGP